MEGKNMAGLGWIDPAFDKPTETEEKEFPFGKPVTGLTKCENCGKMKEWKDIYFDYCKSCVRDAH